MKRTSKLFILLASVGMLVACGANTKKDDDKKPTPSTTPNDINVVYVNKYVSDNRAQQIKEGFIASLQQAGTTVDASKINFFSTENSTVAAYTDEILAYNASNPSNQIDVILGANGFNNAEEESRVAFEEKYMNDGVDYTYGTHTTASYNTTRKFWYDKTKGQDTFVKGLQTYLQANWTEVAPPEESGKLTVMGYSVFVSETRFNEIKTGFQSYMTAQGITIDTLEFVHETETATIAEFMGKVDEYDAAHTAAPVDVLLGLKTNSAITQRGFQNDGVAYNYGDKEDDEAANNDRRFWYKSLTTEVAALQAYMQANWTPDPEKEYYIVGDRTQWNTEAPSLKMSKVADGEYKYEHLDIAASEAFKVYCPQEAENSRWFTNDSTWQDCGFTLSTPDKNIVVTDADTYTIHFYVTGENSRWFTNATTWENCGFTLSEPDKNIVVTDADTYTIHFYVTGENGNHVTLEKEGGEPPAAKFYVGVYDKYVTTNLEALEAGVTAALQAAGVTDEIEYTSLGTGNVAAAAGNIVSGTTILLGFNGDSNNALKNAGYAKYSENSYTYGTDANRKLWIFDPQAGVEVAGSSAREDAATVAVYNYLEANWTPEVEKEYYVVGDMTQWNTEAPTLKMSKVSDNEYKYEGLNVAETQGFKVFCPQLEGDARWFTNDSTWEDCGFTLSTPNKNVVPNEAGKYTVHFYVNGDNNNHITIEKQNTPKFYVGVYNRYVTTNLEALEAGVTAALQAAGITADIEFTMLGGSGVNVATAAGNIVSGTTILLGFNGDSNNALKNAGYAKYSENSYTYGTDANRKLWIFDPQEGVEVAGSSAREDTATIAVYNYLETNWKPAA